MISVPDAERVIADAGVTAGTQIVKLSQAEGRILAQDVKADRDLPPYDRVTMDGISINYQNWQNGQYSPRPNEGSLSIATNIAPVCRDRAA